MYLSPNFARLSFPVKGTLSEINTGQVPFYTKHYMNGTIETKFHPNIIDQLERVFAQDAPRYLSIEQERFFKLFCEQAGIVTDKIKEGDDNPYSDMEELFKQFDCFLGSYKGQKDGRYTR